MKFDELDAKMRAYETASDRRLLPCVFIVARIDGRSFTRLTKEVCNFDVPFDVRFRDLMIETTKHLMTCGFDALYGYTQSDEISLLLAKDVRTFERKERKLISVLAGEASAKFSVLLGQTAAFDCRLCELPNESAVVNYFRWRNEDAHRNALNGHCYWALRGEGKTIKEATNALHRLSVADKNELLFQRGINFNDLPHWQRRGVGVVWDSYEKHGLNPLTNENVTTSRRRLKTELELPMRDDYSSFIKRLLDENAEKD